MSLPSVIQWGIDPELKLHGLSRADVCEAIVGSVAIWQQLLTVPFVRTTFKLHALISFEPGRGKRDGFAGRSKAVANSDCLDLRDPRPRTIRFDLAAMWTRQSLLATAVHEIGHAIGLDHIGDRPSVMAPFIDDLVYAPTAADRRALWKKYPELKP